MANSPATLYKEFILYILHKASTPLPQHMIIDCLKELGFADYFHTIDALGELTASGLTYTDDKYKRTYISLTKAGEDTYLAIADSLSFEVKSDISKYLDDHKVQLKDETNLITDYHMQADSTYLVKCCMKDRDKTTFGIELEVASETDAIDICNRWETNVGELYAHTLRLLLQNSD